MLHGSVNIHGKEECLSALARTGRIKKQEEEERHGDREEDAVKMHSLRVFRR